MGAEKQRKTFLSYSRVNEDFAVRLARELKSEGFNIWLDQLDIPAGARWDREIERALKESEIFMIILTSASVDSENVLDEIGYAIDTSKRILPVLMEKCDVPLRLRRFQYVDFTNKGFDNGVESAKELLRSLIDQPTLPKIVLSEEVQQQMTQAERKAREEAERLAAQKAEEEQVAKVRAETERRTREEAEHLAAQKAEEERLAKAEAERKARAEASRRAEEEAEEERRARQEAEYRAARKAEEERKAKEKVIATETKTGPVVPAQKKPASKVIIYSVAALFVLAILGIGVMGIGFSLLTTGNKKTPASTPTTHAAVVPSITKPPTKAPTLVPTPFGGGNGKIAFVSHRDGNNEIYIMGANGSGQTRLTNNEADDYFPAWSPDGKHIAFESDRDEPKPTSCDACNWELYVMNADGSGQTRMTNNPAGDYLPAWSPDGKHIAFHSKRDGNREIYTMNADGSNQIRLTNNSAEDEIAVWSPDGKHIAFISNRDGNFELYVMNADGSNQIRLTNNTAEDEFPAWSPDGKHIAFISNRDEPKPTSCDPCNWEIYIMNVDGSDQTRLTNNPTEDFSPAWSPDGKHIAFESDRDEPKPTSCNPCNWEIYIMNVDGSDQTRLTSNTTGDFSPAW